MYHIKRLAKHMAKEIEHRIKTSLVRKASDHFIVDPNTKAHTLDPTRPPPVQSNSYDAGSDDSSKYDTTISYPIMRGTLDPLVSFGVSLVSATKDSNSIDLGSPDVSEASDHSSEINDLHRAKLESQISSMTDNTNKSDDPCDFGPAEF